MKHCKQTYSVICSEIDLNSQMRPLATPTYFQDCFIKYAAKRNFATFDLAQKGISWFIAEYNIYLTEDLPFWSEVFDVEVWISKITKLKVFVDFIYTYKGKAFAKGRSVWILFDNNLRKPLQTDILFKNYCDIDVLLEGIESSIAWNNVDKSIRTVEHVVNMTDIDFNEHVNNRSYVNIAITTASKEIQETNYISQLAVKFIKQSYLDDKLVCTSYTTPVPMQFITNILNNGQEICKIFTYWQKKVNNKAIHDCDLDIRKSK